MLVVFCVVVAVWYCVMVSRLWSRKTLSGCSRSSFVRHYCVMLFMVCHWHKYVFFDGLCSPFVFSGGSFFFYYFVYGMFEYWVWIGVGVLCVVLYCLRGSLGCGLLRLGE